MDTVPSDTTRLPAHGPDFKWVLAAQAGYLLAFDELVARNKGRVHRVALAITRGREDAETVLHNTFVKAQERLQEFRGNSRFSTWVLGIAAKESLLTLRENGSGGCVFDQNTERQGISARQRRLERDEEPRERYTRRELKRILSEGLGVLKPLNRTIFILRDLEECSPEEVANFLGLSTPEVKSSLILARLEMRKHLNRCFKREGQAVAGCTISAEGKQKELDNARTISSARA
jgi:RNA polymerase sigma-70 factor (ECF subfamily)